MRTSSPYEFVTRRITAEWSQTQCHGEPDEGAVFYCCACCAGGGGRRGGGSNLGLQVPAEPLRGGREGPHPSVQHLQRWDQCRPGGGAVRRLLPARGLRNRVRNAPRQVGQDRARQQRLSHGGAAPPEGRILQLHLRQRQLPGPGGWAGRGGLHQRPGAGGHPGAERVRQTLLPTLPGLGSVRGDDPPLHRDPPAPVVLQQEEVRLAQEQEELSAACWEGHGTGRGGVGGTFLMSTGTVAGAGVWGF